MPPLAFLASVVFGAGLPSSLPFRLRRARLPDERPAIDDIHIAAYDNSLRIILEGVDPWFDPSGTCFVAVDHKDTICGFVFIVMSSTEIGLGEEDPTPVPRLDDLFVHPRCQAGLEPA